MQNKMAGEAGGGTRSRDERLPMEAIEGTYQCPGCQRFMKLGDGKLCVTFEADVPAIAEIIGWAPGECGRFMKAEPLF